jgi:UDP-N-acetylmuramate dehydrogenase
VRDGGIPGVVVRLGRGFNEIKIEDHRAVVGTAVLDVMVARAAQTAGVGGLAFLSGIPGTIGGALRMNGGAYGGETKDICVEVRGVNRQGDLLTFTNGEMGFSYRHCGVPDDVIFTTAVLQGRAGAAEEIAAEMAVIKKKREASQPRNRTGGSTFKNPPGHSAWKLVDDAGCRGLTIGGAQVSELHSNFLINLGGASAADIETLGETVRQRVKTHSGVELEWEIKRVGVER